MILDVDVGNTSLKWRLSGASGIREGALVGSALEALALPLGDESVTQVRVSCVAGQQFEQGFRHWCEEKLQVTPQFARVQAHRCGLQVGYREPEKLGVDRWLAMLAAYTNEQGACAVVDAGSALTADFIDSAGVHLGGLIIPGATMMREALFARTQGVKVEALTVPHVWQPARDTAACVEQGVGAALTGLVKEIVACAEAHCGAGTPVLACGGDAPALVGMNSHLTLRPGLVLDGLALAFDSASLA